MRRGEVWWVDLGEPIGSEPAFRRPVVIIQDDLLTDSALETVMVGPLTSNLRRAIAIGNVEIAARATGLSKASVALACQVTTVDKSLLTERAGGLSKQSMTQLDRGLMLALGLGML